MLGLKHIYFSYIQWLNKTRMCKINRITNGLFAVKYFGKSCELKTTFWAYSKEKGCANTKKIAQQRTASYLTTIKQNLPPPIICRALVDII